MQISKQELIKKSRLQGYKPDMLEKVYRMMAIFQQMMAVPYFQERLVLKGGTALNLFCFDKLPRLSVDIDLNYIGQLDRETMLAEKPVLIEGIQAILQQNQFEQYRAPVYHAGGKMVWFYNSVLGQRGSLEIDINFMYRQPLFPVVMMSPNLVDLSDWQAPVLDIHELAAGKLAALFNRTASRDLFDAHHLLTKMCFDIQKLRLALVVYLAMTKIDAINLQPEDVTYDIVNIKNRLLPLLQQKGIPRKKAALVEWVEHLQNELQEKLTALLPLVENEIEFIQNIRDAGEIMPELITDDKKLIEIINTHPAIHWAVKQYSE